MKEHEGGGGECILIHGESLVWANKDVEKKDEEKSKKTEKLIPKNSSELITYSLSHCSFLGILLHTEGSTRAQLPRGWLVGLSDFLISSFPEFVGFFFSNAINIDTAIMLLTL